MSGDTARDASRRYFSAQPPVRRERDAKRQLRAPGAAPSYASRPATASAQVRAAWFIY